ncbi:MAG TPA: FAD-dependent oxidoreductase, partial [Solirubrobacterales bacterium]|nr:FAD-dependent oxidoreductase [Solirubrobacterales bacterium]
MDVIIVGAGPTGLTLGAALARRGHRVLAVDRDPGPLPDGTWRRRGVMQFEHPHGFRPPVRDLLLTEWPEAWRAWLALGAEPVELGAPSSGAQIGVRSRRLTYERALRRAA